MNSAPPTDRPTMQVVRDVRRRAYAAALLERGRLQAAARRVVPSDDEAAMCALERAYARQLALLERCLRAPDAEAAPVDGQCAVAHSAVYLQHSIELRPIERVWRPASDVMDAVIAAELLGTELEQRMARVGCYTQDRALLAAARALLNERVWVSVHGMCRYTVLRPPYEGALVEAAARVLVEAAVYDAK